MSKDKLAIDMLRQGGTLLAEPCNVCNGVQIKFKNNIICINCNRTITISEEGNEEQKEEKLHDLRSTITQKINELIPVLINEKKINTQLKIAKLINYYLEILDKIKKD